MNLSVNPSASQIPFRSPLRVHLRAGSCGDFACRREQHAAERPLDQNWSPNTQPPQPATCGSGREELVRPLVPMRRLRSGFLETQCGLIERPAWGGIRQDQVWLSKSKHCAAIANARSHRAGIRSTVLVGGRPDAATFWESPPHQHP